MVEIYIHVHFDYNMRNDNRGDIDTLAGFGDSIHTHLIFKSQSKFHIKVSGHIHTIFTIADLPPEPERLTIAVASGPSEDISTHIHTN